MLFYMVTGTPPTQPVQQNPIDESLFVRIGAGDMDALEELYTTTERTIYAYVLSLLKDPNDTLDIVQETYLKLRAAAHLYQPMGKPLAWMFTIARNLAMDFLRTQKREQSQDYELLENQLDFSYISDPTDRFLLQEALEQLGTDERQIVLLYAVSGLKHREIAANLGIPLSTALSRYHRAIQKLKNILKEEGAFHGA